MKYKNCGVIATKHFFIKEDEVDKYGGDLIPPLTVLEGTITAVPNMQTQLLDYKIQWKTNASLPVSFDVEDLRVKYFKGDESLMRIFVICL